MTDRVKNKDRINSDGELERQCIKCEEWWPITRDFFVTNNSRNCGFTSCCHACFQEIYRPERHCKDFTWDDKLFPRAKKELNTLWAQHGFVRTYYRGTI